ncbi:argininosuccinate synthase domain-containing protein [Streptomyces sp. NPDC016172]|uniref:argininosuccinate synthase domain-containing protein n=1 Tax=Streptomyces sp. NPDC016172 TaxID=3364964 RepID=UPI0036FF11AD
MSTLIAPGEQIGFAVSEGLSSRAVAVWLAEQGVKVHGFLADIGQRPRAELDGLAAELAHAGVPTEVVDLRRSMAELSLDVVRYSARYDDGYWNTTGASRAVLVSELAGLMAERGLGVFGHTSVDGGNDQRRFSGYVRALRPGMRAFTPWSDPRCGDAFAGRADLAAYAAAHGLTLAGDEEIRSVDGNLGGFSHEGTELESLAAHGVVHRLMSVAPRDAPDESETFSLGLRHGRPATVDGQQIDALACLVRANEAGGRNGLGFSDVLENRLNGTKCRGVYEAPGLELLGRCTRRLYQATLSPERTRRMEELSRLLGTELYAGRWFSEHAVDARAELDDIVAPATGTVEVEIYKGNVFYRSLSDVPPGSAVPRQARFGAGGYRWRVMDDSEREETGIS